MERWHSTGGSERVIQGWRKELYHHICSGVWFPKEEWEKVMVSDLMPGDMVLACAWTNNPRTNVLFQIESINDLNLEEEPLESLNSLNWNGEPLELERYCFTTKSFRSTISRVYCRKDTFYWKYKNEPIVKDY